MQIRIETRPIMIAFGENLSAPNGLVVEQIDRLIEALSDEGITAWTSHPVAALAHSIVNAVHNPVPDGDPTVTYLKYLNDNAPAPISVSWQKPFLEAARSAGDKYFYSARLQFKRGNNLSAAADLCSAVSCSIIGFAAIRGWPHTNTDDDLNTVFGLESGHFPQETESVKTLLESLADTGHALNSHYAATMGIPNTVRYGYLRENGYTPGIVMSFARDAIDLAEWVGVPAP